MRQKMHLLDGIDGNNALENSLCLTDSIGEKIITRLNLLISTQKIYCKASNHKGLYLKKYNWKLRRVIVKALDTIQGWEKVSLKFNFPGI